MDTLLLMFDKKIIDEGKKIYKDVSSTYNKINRMFKKDLIEARHFGQFYLYPYFFSEDFTGLSNKDINFIAQAGVMYFDLIMLNDSYFDKQLDVNINRILQKDFICTEAVKLLSSLFPKNDIFWDYFAQYNSEYLEANFLDIDKHYNIIKEYPYEEFKKIAHGKSAIAKAATAALGSLGGDIKKIGELEETQDLFAEAAQLFDDLRDWKEDLKLKQYSWLLSALMIANGLDKEVDEKTVSQLLFGCGYDEKVLDKINSLCEQAMICAGTTSSWIKRLKFMQQRANILKHDLNSMKTVKDEYRRLNILFDTPAKQLDFEESTVVNLLLKQRAKGYPELKHWMDFLHEEGFTATDQYLGGDVFSRAYILNLLLEMCSYGIKIDQNEILSEIEYLVGKKSRFFQVGWSYFPDLPELAPDIDTLSEMVKIWVSTGKNEVLKAVIYNTVDFALCNSRNDNGAFNTWILDENDKSEISIRALKAAKEIWGTEPDPEVNANFLNALSLLDFTKYEGVIEKGVDWLLGMQNEDGYWGSTWYVGNYYGCYICSKLFKKINLKNENVIYIIEYLKKSQNRNGSWGDADGNVLDTSYAISALVDIAQEKEIKIILERGIKYIIDQNDNSGYWGGCNFIKMNLGRVSGKTRIITYKSSILTTAMCINSIVKGKSMLND